MQAITVLFAASVYSLEVVQRALHRFTGEAGVEIRMNGEAYECILRPLKQDGSLSHDLQERVRNGVLDQALREKIAQETAPYRNLVLAHAFAATGLQDA